MKILVVLALAVAFLSVPALAVPGGGDGPAMKCNCHMCPVARSATATGYAVVSALPLVHVDAGEFLV